MFFSEHDVKVWKSSVVTRIVLSTIPSKRGDLFEKYSLLSLCTVCTIYITKLQCMYRTYVLVCNICYSAKPVTAAQPLATVMIGAGHLYQFPLFNFP